MAGEWHPRRAGTCDPDRPRRGWAPEAWRLRCALRVARERIPYATADARLIDGVERWMLYTARGRPVPGPWWGRTCALVTAMRDCLEDHGGRLLVAPWCLGEGAVAAGAEPGGFRPLDLDADAAAR